MRVCVLYHEYDFNNNNNLSVYFPVSFYGGLLLCVLSSDATVYRYLSCMCVERDETLTLGMGLTSLSTFL